MKRLILALAVVLALLAIVDRIAVVAAEREVASRIQQEQGLLDRPDVTIGGFPFLTQAIAGRYDDVDVVLHDLRRGPVPVSRLTAHLQGVRVPLGDVIGGHVRRVPVDRASAQVVVTFADLNAWLAPRHLHLAEAPGGAVRVSGRATVAGRTVEASATGHLSATRDAIQVTAGAGLDVAIPLPGLPFRIRLLRATATPTGIVVDASAEGLVLHTGTG